MTATHSDCRRRRIPSISSPFPFPPPAAGELPDPSPVVRAVAVGAGAAPLLLLSSLQEERMEVRGGIPAELHPHESIQVEYTA